MQIVLGGMFESAFVRMNDERTSPNRNTTGHLYYLDLNRNTDKIFRDGAGTFVALAEAVWFPAELDWNGSEIAERCGVKRSDHLKDDLENRERYDCIDAVVRGVLPFISNRSVLHIAQLDLRGYADDVIDQFAPKMAAENRDIIELYVRRLIHQVLAAGETESYLILGESDIVLVGEIGSFLADSSHDLPFPDLRNKIINPFNFVEGVLNFSPLDIEAVDAVRNDPEIRLYAKKIVAEIRKEDTVGITKAAVEAYLHTEAGRKAQEVFEVAAWVVKPLHYIPGVDAVLTAAEDIKDAANQIVKWKMRYNDWHILGVKMQTIATRDFFHRLKNNYPELVSD